VRCSARASSRSVTTTAPRVTSSSSATCWAVSGRPSPEQAIGASQGDDGAGGPRLRPAVAYDAEAGGVGDYLPGGLSVGPSEKARAPGRGQGGGALTGRSVVGQQRCGCALTGSNIGDGRKPLAHSFADQVSLTALENRLIAGLFQHNERSLACPGARASFPTPKHLASWAGMCPPTMSPPATVAPARPARQICRFDADSTVVVVHMLIAS
jgi:hypothetical protein